jgi:hypothetical protein
LIPIKLNSASRSSIVVKPVSSHWLIVRLLFSTGVTMKRILLAALITAFAAGSAMAQTTCESKAVGKDGKPLAGAAKASFVKKCKVDTCATKAIGKDGKPLSGAAKNSFMTKCEKES